MIWELIRRLEKNTISQGDNYSTACLLDYIYFKKNYKLIAIGLSKQCLMLIQSQYIELVSL